MPSAPSRSRRCRPMVSSAIGWGVAWCVLCLLTSSCSSFSACLVGAAASLPESLSLSLSALRLLSAAFLAGATFFWTSLSLSLEDMVRGVCGGGGGGRGCWSFF